MPGGQLRQLTFGINFGIRDRELRQSNQQVDLFKRNVNQSSGALAGLGTAAITAGRNIKTAFAGALRILERYRYYIYGAFTAMTAGIAGTTKVAGDFEYQITRTGQVARATAQEIDILTRNAKQLGIDTAFTAKEAAQGQELLARAGFEVQEIIGTLPAVLDAAAIEEMELSQASKIVGQTIRTMGYEVDQSRRIIDVLARTSQESMTDVQGLGEALPQVSGEAARMGIEIEELSATLGLLADRGDIGSRAGRRLRGVIQSLISPSTQAKSAIEDLGIDLWDEGELKNITGIIREFETALGDMTAEQREARIGEIFSGRRAATFGKLLDAGSESIAEFTGVLENAGGTAEEMAEEQLDTLRGSVKRLRGSINVAAINIGNYFVPTITSAIDSVTGLINVFNESPSATQKLVGGLLAGTGILLGLTTAILILKGPIMAVIGALGTMGGALGVTASGVLSFIGIATALWLIFEDLYYSIEKGREGIIVPLIDSFFDLIGVSYDVWQVWYYGKSLINDFLDDLKILNQGIIEVSGGIGKLITSFFTFDPELALEGWRDVKYGMANIIEGIKGILNVGSETMLKSFIGIGEIVLRSVGGLVLSILNNIGNSILWVVENSWNAIVDAVNVLPGIELPKIDLPTLPELGNMIISWWKEIIAIGSILPKIDLPGIDFKLPKIINDLQNWWNGIGGYISNLEIPSLSDWNLNFELPNVIGNLKDWWNVIIDWWKDLSPLSPKTIEMPEFPNVIRELQNWWNGIGNYIDNLGMPSLPELDLGFKLPDMIGKLQDWWQNIENWADKNLKFSKLISGAIGKVGNILGISDNKNQNTDKAQASNKEDINVSVQTPTGGTKINRTNKNETKKVEQNIEIPIEIKESKDGKATGKEVKRKIERVFEIIRAQEGEGAL